MGELREVDEVVFGEEDGDLFALAGQFSAEACDDLTEAACLGNGGKFSGYVDDPHNFPYITGGDKGKQISQVCGCQTLAKYFPA
jgi:hypothetical protein